MAGGVFASRGSLLASYFNMVDKISAPGYVATVEDLLKSRVRTSGIVEEAYRIDGVDFVCVLPQHVLGGFSVRLSVRCGGCGGAANALRLCFSQHVRRRWSTKRA